MMNRVMCILILTAALTTSVAVTASFAQESQDSLSRALERPFLRSSSVL